MSASSSATRKIRPPPQGPSAHRIVMEKIDASPLFSSGREGEGGGGGGGGFWGWGKRKRAGTRRMRGRRQGVFPRGSIVSGMRRGVGLRCAHPNLQMGLRIDTRIEPRIRPNQGKQRWADAGGARFRETAGNGRPEGYVSSSKGIGHWPRSRSTSFSTAKAAFTAGNPA